MSDNACRCDRRTGGPMVVLLPPTDGCPVHYPMRPMTLPEALDLLDALAPGEGEATRAGLRAEVAPMLDDLSRALDRLDKQ